MRSCVCDKSDGHSENEQRDGKLGSGEEGRNGGEKGGKKEEEEEEEEDVKDGCRAADQIVRTGWFFNDLCCQGISDCRHT